MAASTVPFSVFASTAADASQSSAASRTNNHNNHSNTSPSWKKRIISLPYLMEARQDAASTCVHINEQSTGILVVGGRNANAPSLDSVECLEWNVQRRWWKVPPLGTPRCGCAVASFHTNGGGQAEVVYVVGGLDGQSKPLASMETFRWGDSEWMPSSPMGTPRWYASAVALPRQEQLLVVGGRDDAWHELDTCELFHAKTQTWQDIVPMSTKRFGCALVYLEQTEQVVALGGYNGQEWSTSCEVYSIDKESWTALAAPMPQSVQFCVGTVVLGDVVVLRGQTADHAVVLQCYSISKQTWRVMSNNDTTLGSTLVSVAQQFLLVLGGANGEELEATNECYAIKVNNLDQLFGSGDAQEAQSADPFWMEDSLREEDDPLVVGASQSASGQPYALSTASASSFLLVDPYGQSPKSPQTSKASSAKRNRRKLENAPLLDNHGVQAVYTGYVTADGGRPHGSKGRMTWTFTGDVYEGSFEQGDRQGRGRMIYSNGDSFEGIFQDGQREGRGVYRYRDGRHYNGRYADDVAQDEEGTMTWKDGTVYKGQFSNSKRTGLGQITFPTCNVQYTGEFVNGKYHGQGSCRFADGSVYQGQWKDGKAHGQGRLTTAQGEVIHDGDWANDGPLY